jgi:hypothetical protein
MKLRVALAALALTGAAVSGDSADKSDVEAIENSDVRIDIGRLGVINERTSEIWSKLRSDEPRAGRHDLRAMNSTLRRTVWEYNLLREDFCYDRFMVEKSCGAPFLPRWAVDMRSDAKTLEELQARQQDLAGHVEAPWEAACERLQKVISHDDSRQYCSIE